MTRRHALSRRGLPVSKAARAVTIALALGGSFIAGVVGAAEPPTYEPSYRYRLRNEMCRKDEAELGARCAKQCSPGYRMEQQGATPVCRRKS